MKEKIKASLFSESISSNTKAAHDAYEQSRWGEKSGEKIVYLKEEALYLMQKHSLACLDIKGRELIPEELHKRCSKLDKRFPLKFSAFKDLRDKGYIVKSALKFGADFRVYKKSESIEENHSKWIVFVSKESDRLTWHDFAAKSRVAHSTKKNLLIAIVDGEEAVSYYEVTWTKT